MKKIFILAIMVAVLVSVFGTSGSVSASPGNPPGNGQGHQKDNGMKGRDGMMGRGGIVGRSGNHNGPLHILLVEAFAAEIGITPAEFQAKLDAKMTILQVLREAGKTDEEILVIIHDAYAAALAKAVATDVITQEQADWLQQKHDQVFANGSLPQNNGFLDGTEDENGTGEGEEIAPDSSEAPVIGSGSTGSRSMMGFGWKKNFKHHKNK
jgi:hypothetical protein